MKDVGSYGLHWDAQTAWLVQGRGGSNFLGLKERCPFKGPRGMCSHLVPVAAPIPDRVHWDQFMEIFYDPLVQAMLPIPRRSGENLYFIKDRTDDLVLYLANLSRLSSPIGRAMHPAQTVNPKSLEADLYRTNIQPFVVIQAKAKQQDLVETIRQIGAVAPRTVVVYGDEDVTPEAPFNVLETKLKDLMPLDELTTLPLESIGAFLLRRHCRHEPLDGPMQTRQERRAGMLKK